MIELRRRNVRTENAPFRAPLAGLVPLIAMAAIAWILSGLTAGDWKAMAVVFSVALVVYFGSLPSRRAASARAVESTA